MLRFTGFNKVTLSVLFVIPVAFLGGCPAVPPPEPPPSPTPPSNGPVGMTNHVDVTLKDRMNNPIPVGSSEPYSPRQTCGECHDIDQIANGFHFQQGRTDQDGNVVTHTDFFNDGREWIRSPGMYGLW